MMLMKGGKPSEDWKSYPVKVIEQFGTIFIFISFFYWKINDYLHHDA